MGYVTKQDPGETVLAAIRRVLAGEVYVNAEMASRLLNQVVGRDPLERSPVENLSDRELEVFVDIGQGHATRDIAKKMCRSVKTVETYRERIKTKLNLKTGGELIRYAIQWSVDNP